MGKPRTRYEKLTLPCATSKERLVAIKPRMAPLIRRCFAPFLFAPSDDISIGYLHPPIPISSLNSQKPNSKMKNCQISPFVAGSYGICS